MTTLELLIAQRAELVKSLQAAEKALSEAKFGSRGDEKKRVRILKKQIKEIDQQIQKAQKFEYMETGLEHGIDVRANAINAGANVVKEAGSAFGSVASSTMGEFGIFGKGRVGLEEQKRLSKQGSTVSNPFTSMSSNNMLLIGGALLVLLLIFKKR